MELGTGLVLALAAISKNVLRSSLAMVGLVIGIAAVLTMVALGAGARQRVSDEVSSAGTNLVYVRAGNYVRGGDAFNLPSGYGKADTLTPEDAVEIGRIEDVELVTAIVDDRAPLSTSGARGFAPVVGCEATLPEIHGLDVSEGAFFRAADVEGRSAVAVLGAAMRTSLFGKRDPVGQAVRIRERDYVVVGVVESADAAWAESVFVPFPALQDDLGIGYVHGVTVVAETAGDTTRIGEEIRRILRARHGLDDPERAKFLPRAVGPFAARGTGLVPDDFTVRTEAARALTKGLYTPAAALVLASMPRLDQVTSEEMVSTLARANRTMTLLLGSIAAVSLVVGGIGIMNVMLLSVTERTKEVGLRISVGAKARDVLLQFLLEAVALSLAGGVVGVVFGLASTGLVTALLEWPTYVSSSSVALAFGLAFAVGVAFGYYPAYRASRLDPIDALRYE
jgi:ABC-type antimicrobial peptide transport system permease subunit